MSDWVLVPCLVTLRNEFNKVAPSRDKSSDGSIGDPAHKQTVSDHNADEVGNVPTHDADKINEVHAIDVDIDLKVPGLSMEKIVQFLLNECRKPGTSGKDRGRLKYIIFNKRIWTAEDGWIEKKYKGKNPHDKHAHFSAEYKTGFENDTRPWGLVEEFGDELPMEQETFNSLFRRALQEEPEAFASAFLYAINTIRIPDYSQELEEGEKPRELTLRSWIGYADGRADVGRVAKDLKEFKNEVSESFEVIAARQDTLAKKFDELITKLSPSQSRGAVNL